MLSALSPQMDQWNATFLAWDAEAKAHWRQAVLCRKMQRDGPSTVELSVLQERKREKAAATLDALEAARNCCLSIPQQARFPDRPKGN